MAVKSPEIVEVSIPQYNIPTPVAVADVDEIPLSGSIQDSQTAEQPVQPEVEIVVTSDNHDTVISISTVAPVEVEPAVAGEKSAAQPEINISAFSLKSIRAKKELEQATKANVKEDIHLPTEAFNETDMLLQWTKYAQRLSDKGQKIMESLMLINDPKLRGTTVIHELPNEGAKIDFESGKHELIGYLRGKLHNHDIEIQINVNETVESRKAFTPQDRYNRLNELNPSLELLRKTFDLDF